MKKAKIMLMAIAVLAVVGGAVAFKAKTNFIPHTFGSLCNTTIPVSVCNLTTFTSLVVTTSDVSKTKVQYAPSTKPCITDADCFTYTLPNPGQ